MYNISVAGEQMLTNMKDAVKIGDSRNGVSVGKLLLPLSRGPRKSNCPIYLLTYLLTYSMEQSPS